MREKLGYGRKEVSLGANFLNKLHKNDRVRIIDVRPYTDLLELWPNGSIEKIGTVDVYESERLLRGHQITPPYKISIINQEQTRDEIKVTLHKVYLSYDYTRLFATIENINEKTEVMLDASGLKAIQNKKQFVYTYHTDSRYRMIKSRIPPGVEETGVLMFEPLDSEYYDIRFLLPFWDNTFVFNVKL